MREKNFTQKHVRHMFAAFALLFLIPFLSVAAGIQAQAAEERALVDNPTYTFTSTDGSKVSTKANPGETTVLIFGNTACSYTRSMMDSLTSSDGEWISRPDIRVIFAEAEGHTKEEIQLYEDGYKCPDITFCYDESGEILQAMFAYAQLFGKNGAKYPLVFLIDGNNKIEGYLERPTPTGDAMADNIFAIDILNGIKKFANIDYEGTLTPPSGTDSGIVNYAFGLEDINGNVVSTKANPNETTVLIFGYTTCGKTKATLQSIADSDWGKAHRSDIRLVYADTQGANLEETKAFAGNYSDTDIIFCHDANMINFNNVALKYLSLYNQNGGTFPYIVYIDKNNKVQNVTLGPKTAEEILKEINKIAENAGTTPDGNTPGGSTPDGNTPGGSTPDGTDPGTTPGTGQSLSISDVTGLKTISSTKSIKLTWKKVSKANGYIIYQYNSSKKSWVKKATLTKNTASYTVKKLTPATGYRFAVKAYLKAGDGEQVVSKSYKNIYTATTPNAVSFKVTSGKKKAAVKWSKQKGATGYTVYYKVKASDQWKKLKTTKGSSYTKTKLKSGKTYIFTVKAYKTYKGKTYTSSFRSKKVKIK